MAPTRPARKAARKSDTTTVSTSTGPSAAGISLSAFPKPPSASKAQMNIGSPARTPPADRSPIRKTKMGITAAQKQALIDNLQLEVTERARKLRAQYALQAQGLRSRIEIRVNRIPTALRKAKMGDLMLKYSDTVKVSGSHAQPALEKGKSPVTTINQERYPGGMPRHASGSPSLQHGHKRMSDEMNVDKENEDAAHPSKRVRGGPILPTRTTSRGKLQVAPSQVLSPRSANSRTLPRSPIRTEVQPKKSFLARPASPLKSVAPAPIGGTARVLSNMVEKAKSTRGAAARKAVPEASKSLNAAGRGRRAAPLAPAPASRPATRAGGRTSTMSDSSEGSNATVIRKPAAKKAPEKFLTTKRSMMNTLKGIGGSQRKATTAKVPAQATTGRVLRKRN